MAIGFVSGSIVDGQKIGSAVEKRPVSGRLGENPGSVKGSYYSGNQGWNVGAAFSLFAVDSPVGPPIITQSYTSGGRVSHMRESHPGAGSVPGNVFREHFREELGIQ